jgi:hypothetical protein
MECESRAEPHEELYQGLRKEPRTVLTEINWGFSCGDFQPRQDWADVRFWQ